jgi:hypothetical protein
MTLAFDEELRSIAALAKAQRDKLALAAAKPPAPVQETFRDIKAIFEAFPFCQEHGAVLSSYQEQFKVGSDKWQKTFDYECVAIAFEPNGSLKSGFFVRVGPGDKMLRADEDKVRLMNVNTFACVAVGAKECAMELARLLAKHV